MKPLAECVLYTFIDSAYLHGRDVTALARDLCEGGSDLIQLRAKDWPVGKIEAAARGILPITKANGVRLVVNDHLAIAEKIGADICHLGQEDFFDAGHQHVSQLGTRVPIGLSTHAPEQAGKAVRAGAHYVAIGPVYRTDTKPTAKPVTLDYVRWAAEHVRIPWFAIGGINLHTLEDVRAAGARRVCVVSAILTARDVKAECRKFKARLQ
ncbi:MAG: thiamine phosphate synthase [Limisphaerales bacterium]